MAALAFDYAAWSAGFPELAAYVGQPLAATYWQRAVNLCAMSGPLTDGSAWAQSMIGLVTAHITKINGPIGGQPASDIVGRIANATEGSVTVGTDFQVPGSAAWFAQTKYGAEFWQATASFRTMQYRASPGRSMAPQLPGSGYWVRNG
jgi:hypothetical protein